MNQCFAVFNVMRRAVLGWNFQSVPN